MTARWESIKVFTIESATGNNRLYANGRQTIKVRMAIQVEDINSQIVQLTEKERLSITLVNYHGGKPLKYTDHWTTAPLPLTGSEKWDWSIQNIGGYLHFPTPGLGTRSLSDEVVSGRVSDTAYIDFYMRTVDLNPLTVGVRITRDDGQVFYSRDNGGSVELSPVAPTFHRPSNYKLEKTVIVPFRRLGVNRGGVAWLDYYRLRLDSEPNLQFRDVTCAPGGLHGDTGPGWQHDTANMVGYIRPAQKTINYLFPLMYVDPISQWDARPGDIIFTNTYVAADGLSYFRILLGRTAVLRCSVTVMDVYGNVHTFGLRFENNARQGALEIV